MSITTRIIRSGAAAAMALLLWGCAGSGGGAQLTPTGHPTGYVNVHWSDYAQKPDSCTQCHGSITDRTQAGGISGVSCFSCHADGPAHPANWGTAVQHGKAGAGDVAGDWTGMASCGKCHGDDLKGGLTSTSCFQCHTKAPHPDAPWGPTVSNPNPTLSHTFDVSATNAAECWRCHANNQRLTVPGPAATSATSPQPGCFNGTMCHGQI